MKAQFQSIFPVLAALCLVIGCGRSNETAESPDGDVQGGLIAETVTTNIVPAGDATLTVTAATHYVIPPEPGEMDGDYLKVGFDYLSTFDYVVYEEVSPEGGRNLLKSDSEIPARVKALDGRRVAITGFILPLRLKRGQVTEFLLLRDQGACCFGPQAQMNHYIRVDLGDNGFVLEQGTVPMTVYGVLRVGEIFVGNYLTGIYQMEGEKVQ